MTLALAPRRPRIAAFLVAALVALSGVPAIQAAGRLVSVIVTSGSASAAASSVRSVGGIVDRSLPIVDGALARVPESSLADLSRVAVVVPDRPVHVQSQSFGDGLVSAYPAEVGATSLWQSGETGRGVTVALVDTGIADVPDLRGRVVARADLTAENDNRDAYGHGTFMAGLIAGNGESSGGRYVGVAPEADLVAVKVAGADGSTTLGRVLVGVQIVDSSRQRFDIGVALLALDSGSPLPPELDPLSSALRRLWAHGVTVVVPAGNDGPEPGSIAAPGEDPVLLTAASVNDMGTADVFDDTPSEFSGRGPTRWGDEKPDVAAPGEHLVSLRAPGSTIDTENPQAVVEDAYFKGTGTSMSAAVTAGAAALLLGDRHNLSPDEVKAVLMATANPLPGGEADTIGAGVVNAADAVALGDSPDHLPGAPAQDDDWQGPHGRVWDRGDGVVDLVARQWAGQAETAARQWAARQWAEESWEARQWQARQWAARQWAARQWAARQWAARQWQARQWAGSDWLARQWAARQWSFDEWAARQWSARQWSARQWSQEQWEARQWEARQWSARQWEARQWSARQWEARQWEARQWG